MKPLGTNNAAENELTTPKSAFVPTNSQSRVSEKKFDSVTQKVTAPKNKSTAETMPIFDFYQAD